MISNETITFEESPLTNHPGTVVGYRANGKPIYNVAGGSIEVTTDDSTDNDDTDVDATDDDSDEGDNWEPPTRDDWLKLQADKRKADSEAAARKRWMRDAGLDPKTGKTVAKPKLEIEDDDTADVIVADKKTETQDDSRGFNREKFEQQFQRQLDREVEKASSGGRKTAYPLISEVPAALDTAGWNGKNLPRMIKLLDLDSIEIDEDGVDYDALEAQVTELKKDFPEFFKRSRMKDAAKEVADTSVAGGGKKQAPASTEGMDWKTRMKLQLQQGGGA